ncbi:MAG TPA: hypothetical protein VMW24_17750 [Sedimentisphaerales bacterium]|nr:hypothetical protein [Sedimentisphaerales bacterium]
MPRIAVLIESSRAAPRSFLRGIARYAHLYGPWAFCRLPPVYKSGALEQGMLFSGYAGGRARRTSSWNEDQINGIIAHVGNREVAKSLIPRGCPAVVALETFRKTKVAEQRGQAVSFLKKAAEHWADVVVVTDAHYRAVPAVQLSGSGGRARLYFPGGNIRTRLTGTSRLQPVPSDPSSLRKTAQAAGRIA